MLRSYLKTGIRHLLRNKSDALINTGGLALGISIAMLIGLWVYDEISFNEYHQNHASMAQVYKRTAQKWLPYPLAIELKENYHASFRSMATTNPVYDHILSTGTEQLAVAGQFAEPALPEMLTLEMLEGSRSGLSDAHSILLSESVARSFFGNTSAIDRLIKIDNKSDVKVTGVYKDLPHHSSFSEVKFLAPWELYMINNAWVKEAGWDNHFVFVYVELLPNVTFEQVAPRIVDAELNVIRNLDYMKAEADEKPWLWLHPMDKWHLYSDVDPATGSARNGPILFVYLVATIGVFVLLLACINFMNLATARSEKRMFEVGIRKAIGSLRSQLIGQFFAESFIVVVISFFLAIATAFMFLPAFNHLAGKQIVFPFGSSAFWLAGFLLTVITGTIAASYPALYLSSFRPAVVLKGKARSSKFASFFRRTLVTVQFTVSISLIIATIVVYQQLMFAKNRDVGYLRDRLVMVPARAMNPARYETLRSEIMSKGVAKEVASAGGKVTSAWSQGGGFEWTGKDPSVNPTFGTLGVSQQFGKTVGWRIVAGRDFEEGQASDSSALVINEAAAKEIGMMNPVGEIVHWKSKWHFMDKDFRIIGIVSNLTMKSPYDNVMPAVFYLQNFISIIHIRLQDGIGSGEAVAGVESAWRKLVVDQPFEYQFADDEYNAKFAYEERVGKLATVFSVLAIAISCLGLFGMASFMTERRTKEIGIRKVVGASVFGLWKMMSSEFVVLITVSWVIASPIAWYALSRWVENFTYRTSISWEVFAAAGSGSLIVTILTVSYRLLEAANRNPVKSLRAE